VSGGDLYGSRVRKGFRCSAAAAAAGTRSVQERVRGNESDSSRIVSEKRSQITTDLDDTRISSPLGYVGTNAIMVRVV